jgi:threonylcarbamoyladenosine tRNA methylthiotransferase MtaB
MDCTPTLIRIASRSTRIAPHFHLPLQHGSDEMLAAMRRPYTAADYRTLVKSIRASIEHASIGTDLIVGFPGETDAHFEEMVRLVESLPVSYLHVFPYSDRPGTDAARMAGKVDGDTIRKRGRVLRAIGTQKAAAFRASQCGKTVRALTVDDGRSAVTTNYLKVQLADQRPRNTWVTVTL